MVLYLQGTHNSMKIWVVHGLATRTALQLGLHSTEANKAWADPIQAEVRRRVWGGMVLHDATLSMTLGRPSHVSEHRPFMATPQIYADSAARGVLDHDETSLAFFRGNLDLYDICSRIIKILYGGNFGGRMKIGLDKIGSIYSLEADLIRWSETLGSHVTPLQLSEVNSIAQAPVDITIRRLRTIMTLRFMNARILIHRPLLEGLLENMSSNQPDTEHIRLMRQAGTYSIKTALSCATRCISTVYTLVVGADSAEWSKQLGAWWFTVYYVFQASLTIIASLIISRVSWGEQEILTTSDRTTACQTLHDTLQILDAFDEGHLTISRTRTYLQDLVRIAAPFYNEQPDAGVNSVSISQPASGVNNRFPSSGLGYSVQQPVPMMASSTFRQFASDIDLESFMFPTEMQNFGGPFTGTEQPLI